MSNENRALEWRVTFDEYKVALLDYNVHRWIDRRLHLVDGTITHVSGLTYDIKFSKRKRQSTIERYFLHSCTASVKNPRLRFTLPNRFEGLTPQEIEQFQKEEEQFHNDYNNYILQQEQQKEQNELTRLITYQLRKQ